MHWRYTLKLKDVLVDNSDELEESQIVAIAQALAERINKFVDKLNANNELRYELGDVAWEFGNCTTVEEIDDTLYMMYDICDANKIWVK